MNYAGATLAIALGGCKTRHYKSYFLLMIPNERYRGIGNILANGWSILLLVKYLLVLIMVGLGVYQGKKVMPDLARVSRQVAGQSSDEQETVSSFESLEKIRKRITQVLCRLAMIVLLLTAVGDIL